MKAIHVPATFGADSRPHIARIDGQWLALLAPWGRYPSGIFDDDGALGTYLRKMNNSTLPRRTSTRFPEHERMQ